MSYTPQGHTQQEASGQDSKTYRYNAAERLITYESSDGTLAHYRYDPFGRRISKSVTKDAATQVTYFIYSEQALMGELDKDGKLQRAYGFNPVAGQQGLWSTDPVWQADSIKERLANLPTEYTYLHVDHLFTPILGTDKLGEIFWSGVQESFGLARALVKVVNVNLRFPGQYLDEESQYADNLHREYSAQTGRYIRSDPIGLAGGVNIYGYSHQNPLSFGDVSGKAGVIICVYPVPGCSQDGRPVPPPPIALPTLPQLTFPDEKCYRYEYRDCNDDIVYIGITNDLERRAKEHEYDGVVAKYACKQCRITKTYWEEVPNRATCNFREKLSILWNRPIFNSKLNPEHPLFTIPKRIAWKKQNCPCEGVE